MYLKSPRLVMAKLYIIIYHEKKPKSREEAFLLIYHQT